MTKQFEVTITLESDDREEESAELIRRELLARGLIAGRVLDVKVGVTYRWEPEQS